MTLRPAKPLHSTSTPRRHIASQGALLFAGFGVSQSLSLIRNGIIGHALSPADFGVAALLTLLLQLTETLSDLGSDRLIVQADDGDSRAFVASAHAVLLMRGVLIASFLFLSAPLFTAAFAVPQALLALQITALAPLIKGAMHLDLRVAQRHLNNTPQIITEVAPQALALALVFPVLSWAPDFSAVAWLAVAQALTAVVVSHALAKRRYDVSISAELFKRHFAFGWPVLVSALPLVAVYQGERLLIGQTLGVEALAAFSVAFTVTMVPGLIAAKAGHALLLPLFSEALRRTGAAQPHFVTTFLQAAGATVSLAGMYLAAFIIAGDSMIVLVFGPNYPNLGLLASILAAMWALRMIQAVPGMALMAHGETKPFVAAGIIRAHALLAGYIAAHAGAGVLAFAAIALVFEALSLLYVSVRMNAYAPHLAKALLVRAALLVPAGLAASGLVYMADGSLALTFASLVLGVAIAGGVPLALLPDLRRCFASLVRRRAQTAATAAE